MTNAEISSMLALFLETLAEHTKDKRFKAALRKVIPFFKRDAKKHGQEKMSTK